MFAALASSPAPAQARLRTEGVVTSPVVRLGDVADLGAVPASLRAAAAAIPVMRFSEGQSRARLPGALIAERARGAMPALAAWTEGFGSGQVLLTRTVSPGAPPAAMTACLRARRSVTAGAVAVRDDFEPAACREPADTLAYDRAAGLARARSDLLAGALVRGAPQATLSAVRPGQRLTLRAMAGAVAVQREVEVVRPARPRAPISVRGDDGEIFAAPALREDAPA